MLTVSYNPKYYRIRGVDSFNFFSKHFYRILRCIGKELHGTNSKCISVALSEIRKRVAYKGQHVSNKEIRNLIQASYWFTNKSASKPNRFIVYRISRKSHLILESLFELVSELKRSNNNNLILCYKSKIEEGKYCRLQIINGLDEKLGFILTKAPSHLENEVNEFSEKILQLRHPC